ncbi:Rieske (2Fe-2S) protein [Flavisolibacter ginsenosidimutans]|uniref:Rieske 2Fe-2S domain-containing protein n=1 Tax=Flavisolibacter ginsenosidimutans TaxID=661481 RepID=A0A5B8UM42_9BACT|nr:Rieske 2Fe-2S domain-containing protein [Flavisolibacter ginsenosidimutans]QEC57623.1 Rieske 2Fe-2S domain-containing protein [Flavisolibacter ginsenosidimutans]
MEKRINWVKIAESVSDIPFDANEIAEVMAGDKRICIGKHKEELFAFAHKCPHASGFFSEGFIDALGNVVCPVHHYKFCMKNGRNISGEGYYLKHWPVALRKDGVFIGFDSRKLFDFF